MGCDARNLQHVIIDQQVLVQARCAFGLQVVAVPRRVAMYHLCVSTMACCTAVACVIEA